jgi:hypothetical protein
MTNRWFLILLLLAFSSSAWAGQCTQKQIRNCKLNCGPPADVGTQQFQQCMNNCTAQCAGGGSPGPGPGPGNATQTAIVGNVISSPLYVNLYWDSTWDVDNPLTPAAALDNFTTAILSSSYFSGLSEYGVTSASYGGGFFPAAACPQKPPSRVGFYDPVNPSIVGFLSCEIGQPGVPTGNDVIYNIVLPSFSLESDAFGSATECQSVAAEGWHFHNTPYNPAVAASIAAAILTSGGTLSLPNLLQLLTSPSGPIYTIHSAAPQCGTLTTSLLHEMVEAATDPFPPVSVILTGGGEVVDLCQSSSTPTNSFVPAIGDELAGGAGSAPFATISNIQVPQYFSNQRQSCITGFSNTTLPSNPLAITVNSGQGPTLNLSIVGSGFENIPAPFALAANVTLPYIAIQDATQNWQAGNSLNMDLFGLNITSWSPNAIKINGIAQVGTDFTMQSTDTVSAWICNPTSGNCATGSITFPPGPTMPNLAIALAIAQPQSNVPYVVVFLDGKSAGSLGNNQATPWIPVSVGTHKVSASATSATESYTISYGGDCNASGKVTLGDGQNLNCVVTVINDNIINTSGCPSGTRCCGAGSGHCARGQCVSTKRSCP